MLAFTGFNGFGQFGENCGKQESEFKFITVDDNMKDNQDLLIACGWSYTAFAWGNELMLQGILSGNSNSKINIKTIETIKQISACDSRCLVLLENGELYNILPRLDAKLVKVEFVKTPTPKKRDIFGISKNMNSIKITHIAVGNNIAVAIADSNVVYSIPSQIFQFPKPVRVQQCVCGLEHALLLTSNGDVYSWGNGMRGQLGIEPLQVHEKPVLVDALAGIKICAIAAGGWHSAAISSFGDIYTWGFNSNGQLGIFGFLKSNGLKAPTVYPLPQLSSLPSCCIATNCTPIKIVSGARHIVVQMSCSKLFATGWNKYGQLGPSFKRFGDSCDNFQRLCIENNIISLNGLEIVCGSWSTIIKGPKVGKML